MYQRQPSDALQKYTTQEHNLNGISWWEAGSQSYAALRYKNLQHCFARKMFGHTQILLEPSQTASTVLGLYMKTPTYKKLYIKCELHFIYCWFATCHECHYICLKKVDI